jgi:4-alpha-glucanotransferase
MIVLNIFSTYKYCQISQAGKPSLELGPNREVDIELSSPKQPRYVVLSDGALRVIYSIELSAKYAWFYCLRAF